MWLLNLGDARTLTKKTALIDRVLNMFLCSVAFYKESLKNVLAFLQFFTVVTILQYFSQRGHNFSSFQLTHLVLYLIQPPSLTVRKF